MAKGGSGFKRSRPEFDGAWQRYTEASKDVTAADVIELGAVNPVWETQMYRERPELKKAVEDLRMARQIDAHRRDAEQAVAREKREEEVRQARGFITRAEVDATVEATIAGIAKALKTQIITPLQDRIKALETRDTVTRHPEEWQPRGYKVGSVVTKSGTTYVSVWDTSDTPGTDTRPEGYRAWVPVRKG